MRLASGAPLDAPDLLVDLQDAGFVTLAGVGDADAPAAGAYPGTDPLALVAGGPETVITPVGFARVLATSLVDVSVPTLVGEVWAEVDGGAARGAWLAPILDDEAVAERVSTVDDVDLTEGRIAAPLALSDLVRAVVGHFGYGEGAQSPLPEVSPLPVGR
jgi:hypothetical protein